MRYAILIAALLTFAAATPNATLAFEADTSSNTNPDGSQRYVDPDDNPQFGPTESSSGNSPSAGHGMLFGGGVVSGYSGSSDSAGPGEQPWLAPRMRAGH
jgi:hypothetical protein